MVTSHLRRPGSDESGHRLALALASLAVGTAVLGIGAVLYLRVAQVWELGGTDWRTLDAKRAAFRLFCWLGCGACLGGLALGVAEVRRRSPWRTWAVLGVVVNACALAAGVGLLLLFWSFRGVGAWGPPAP
jgi:hypothetical protein